MSLPPTIIPKGSRFARAVALISGMLWFSLAIGVAPLQAATFTNSASLKVDDTNNALTSTNGIFTVSCWFRLAIPSGETLADNMTIVMDRADGNTNANHSYLIRFNVTSGDIEFDTKGTTAQFTKVLIQRPYLERWYHVAVVRNNSSFTFYVDGRQIQNTPESGSRSVGTTTGSGLAVGGVGGTTKQFSGDVIELAIYQSALSQSLVQQRMFEDQRGQSNLRGYFKLGYSTNSADFLRNFVPVPVTGTDPLVRLGTGTVEFEETDQAGEQSIFDSRKNRGQDAMAPLSGAFSWQQTALARPVPGIAFDFRFGYSSGTPAGPPADGSTDPFDRRVMGPGWRHSFDARVMVGRDLKEFNLFTWDGAIETWTRSNALALVPFQTRHKEYRGDFIQLASGEVEWTTPERLIYKFRDPSDDPVMAGRLIEIRDFNNNVVRPQWNESEGFLTNIIDSASGRYDLKYDPLLGLLTNITFQQWSVQFTYYTNGPTNGFLASKTLTNASGLYTNAGTTWQFFYTNGSALERVTDPRGNTNTFVVYDRYGRKIEGRDALGRITRTEFGVPGKRQIRHTDPGSFPWVETFDRKHRLLSQTDPLNQTTRYTYDAFGNRTSIADPLGYTSFFGYDSRANVIARTNALGEVTRWVMHAFFNKAIREINPLNWTNYFDIENATGNLLRHYDDLGTLVTYAYATNGLVLTSADGNNRTNRFAYDPDGFLIARADAAGFTNRIGNNEVGWKLAETNALNQVSTVSYDLNGKVVRALDPKGRVFIKTYDANGNLLTESDAKLNFTSHAYDAADQRTNTMDRAGFTSRFTYTDRGKLEQLIDAYGNSITNFYDNANRLERVSDALGNTVTNVFDANGNKAEMVDQLGRRWKTTYDRLNRAVTQADPFGNRKRTSFDAAGRVATITTPNGSPSTHAYDGRGRLALWKDAEGFDWRYQYDGVGNITNIVDALNGSYRMGYDVRNARTNEVNQDGKEWRYAYDPLLRLQQQTDPNGTTRTLSYDVVGRVLAVTFNTGRTNSFYYDDNNNPVELSRSGSGPATLSQLSFDRMDRVVEYTDTFTNKVTYTYDRLGRVDSTTYPGGRVLTNSFDAISRLTNQVFHGQFTNTYAYDLAGRLIRRGYPNGIVQTNVFDEAGRLTALSYLTNTSGAMLAYTYAYDRNGNKTSSTEKGTLNWPMPSLTDETSRFTPAGRLMDRQITPLTTNGAPAAITYQYDASGNMTNAVGNGQFWRLTYDEDNRVTSLAWDCVLTARNITNRYDALGRRVAKTVDGAESRFVLDLSGKMERILCDVDGVGAVTAWYVHGPDLSFKVDATNGLTCYHADAMANIVATTDGTKATVSQYAYTPYGRSLGETNCSTNRVTGLVQNPYRFVGSQGVMEDLPDLYFMRARYYLAEAGVFLSTDPVKKIGPGWKPIAYSYSDNDPLSKVDPKGEVATHLAAFGTGFKAGAAAELEWREWAMEAGKEVVVDQLGWVSEEAWDAADHSVNLLVLSGEVVTSAGIVFSDPSLHGLALVAGYWSGKAAASKGRELVVNALGSALSASIPSPHSPFPYQSRGTRTDMQPQYAGQQVTLSQTQGASSSSGSQLPERYASAAAYAESQNVNYATSSKQIQNIYDRSQTARNNVIDSVAKGKPANMCQSAWMDSMVKQMNKDLGLTTTPSSKTSQPKKKK